jgi:hypothetical protein
MKETTTKHMNKIMMGILLLLFLIVVYIDWLALAPVTVVKPNVQPYKIATPVVQAGKPLIYVANVCKYRSVHSVVTRTFVDSSGVHYTQPPQASNIPAGCGNTEVAVPTPLNLHSGVWYLDIDAEYQVNVFRSESYHFRTDPFTIVNTVIN